MPSAKNCKCLCLNKLLQKAKTGRIADKDKISSVEKILLGEGVADRPVRQRTAKRMTGMAPWDSTVSGVWMKTNVPWRQELPSPTFAVENYFG